MFHPHPDGISDSDPNRYPYPESEFDSDPYTYTELDSNAVIVALVLTNIIAFAIGLAFGWW